MLCRVSMEAPWLLTLLLITGPLSAAFAASDSSSSQQSDLLKHDCDRGCPLTTYPVCGADGEWYQNACMAFCAHVAVDSSRDACRGAPMPFEDAKPGPHGAESGRPGGVVRLIDKAVINAFRNEGLRYVGRIKLAREMGPRPKNIGSNMRLPAPEEDGNGNWQVSTLRCTSDGDVYKGNIAVPMAAMDLKAFEPNKLFGNLFKGIANRPGRAQAKPVADQLLQESGSYDSLSPDVSLSDTPGLYDPSRHKMAASNRLMEEEQEEQQLQQQRPRPRQQQQQRQNPLTFIWSKMRQAAGGLNNLIRPGSGSSSSSSTDPSSAQAGIAAVDGSSSSSSTAAAHESNDAAGLLWATPGAVQESAAAGGAHTISFESAAIQQAAAYADGPAFGSDSAAAAAAAEEHAEDAALLTEVMGDVQEDGTLGSAYSISNSTTSGGRRLREIINGDDRFLCDKGYPYTAIGQIQVVDNTGLYICTGVLIRPNKVLTAAHCVWNTKRNAFYYNLNYAPGRYRHDGKMVNPWGVVPWKSVTVFDAFKKDPATWDVAVVTLSKNLGSVTGYMGMAAGCSSNTELTLAGYPQDQAQGTCMANTCRIPYLDCNALTNIHTCDTIMGMSGSPLWDSKNRIRMIHVAGIAGRPENRATTVTQFLINTVSKW